MSSVLRHPTHSTHSLFFSSLCLLVFQYYVIQLTNFQAGLDGITTFLVLSVAIYLFRTYLINKSWRRTSYCSNIFAATLGLLWLPAYWGSGDTRNPYYTIFVDLDQSFVQGISQVGDVYNCLFVSGLRITNAVLSVNASHLL